MYNHNDVLFDRYKVERFLGKGSFGEVYLASHMVLKVFRAVKCIRKYPHNTDLRCREADILKSLRHPGIPIIYDIEENDEYYFIIEEFIDGMSLKSFISTNKSISIKNIIMLTVELCDILDYLHKNGILHNDIKPDNIIVCNGHIKLLDYGNSIVTGTEPGVRMGTKKYAAPELYGKEEIEAVSDIYSIGAVLLFMITGSKSAEQITSIHPQKLQNVVAECLKHSKKERIKSVNELKKRLLKISKGKSVSISSKIINIAGVMHHQGTTHCAIMAFIKLYSQNKKIILCEKNDSGDFIRLIRYADSVSFNGGIVTADKITYLPNYKEFVNNNILSGYEYIINDYGMLTPENASEIMKGDEICLVTGAKPYELDKLKDAMTMIKETKNLVTLINFTDAKSYHKAVKKYDIHNPVRVPFCPNPK